MDRTRNIATGGWLAVARSAMTRGHFPYPPIPQTAERTYRVVGNMGETMTGYEWEADHGESYIVDHLGNHIGSPMTLKQRVVRVPAVDRTTRLPAVDRTTRKGDTA